MDEDITYIAEKDFYIASKLLKGYAKRLDKDVEKIKKINPYANVTNIQKIACNCRNFAEKFNKKVYY